MKNYILENGQQWEEELYKMLVEDTACGVCKHYANRRECICYNEETEENELFELSKEVKVTNDDSKMAI